MATEYISREAAIEAIRSECVGCVGQKIGERFCCKCAIRQREVALYSVPAADVRPVVYCKDCKHSDTFSQDCTESTFPLKCLSVRYGGVFPHWFCEHGERKGGADMRKVVEIDQVKEGEE